MKRPEFWYADQLPHWAVGTAISACASLPFVFTGALLPAPSIFIGVLVSWGIGSARELIQNWGDAPSKGAVEDTQIDLIFWTLGAFTGVAPALWA